MIRLTLLAFLAGFPILAQDKNPDELTGTWVTNAIDSGEGPKLTVAITYTFKDGKLTSEQGKGPKEYTYKIDSTKDPKEIDMDTGKEVRKGIYKIEKDTLTICQTRPTKADAKRPEFPRRPSRQPRDCIETMSGCWRGESEFPQF